MSTMHPAYAKAKFSINIAYLSQEQKNPPQLSNLDPFVKDKGLKGAELGIADDNTTGEFTGQQFNLVKFIVPIEGNIVDTFNKD
ncbi:MAG: branched-chain amino acid ABC transporter substrate-binding protein, partial [Methylococcales bacterium]|nr:branched-chain amino acid ABC transporter substrate-binding protein [Methylococcales bacterium]